MIPEKIFGKILAPGGGWRIQAVEAARRQEARHDAAAREHLAKARWLRRKNPERRTRREERRWGRLKDKPLVTGLAYAMRLEWRKARASAGAVKGSSIMRRC